MEKFHYIEAEKKVVIETTYDPEDTIEQNKEQRATGREYLGSKGQRMLHVGSIPVEHVTALFNQGYNLLSPDPDEVRRAMLYVQSHEPVWMTVDGKPIASFRQRWV